MKWYLFLKKKFEGAPIPEDAMEVYYRALSGNDDWKIQAVRYASENQPLSRLIGCINWDRTRSRYTSGHDYFQFVRLLDEYETSLRVANCDNTQHE